MKSAALQLQARFDWSVPARFTDPGGDHTIDYFEDAPSIGPPAEGWPVNFDATSATGDIAPGGCS